jgi:hypothetical protein
VVVLRFEHGIRDASEKKACDYNPPDTLLTWFITAHLDLALLAIATFTADYGEVTGGISTTVVYICHLNPASDWLDLEHDSTNF